MKVRTEAMLLEVVDADLIWRKKELTQVRFLLQTAAIQGERSTMVLRGAVTLLYAHWEGFIKVSGRAYLEFVSRQRLKFNELTPPFLALAAKKLLTDASTAKRIKPHIALAKFFTTALNEPSLVPYKDGITTRANLSSDALEEIVVTLGLDFGPFETKRQLIDETLLDSRNTIAHGEYLTINQDRYEELSREVLAMMEDFRNQIQNAAVLKEFRVA